MNREKMQSTQKTVSGKQFSTAGYAFVRGAEAHGDDELMTPAEVAEFFGVPVKTVTHWASSGRLSSVRTPGGHRRYHRTDVEALHDRYIVARLVRRHSRVRR